MEKLCIACGRLSYRNSGSENSRFEGSKKGVCSHDCRSDTRKGLLYDNVGQTVHDDLPEKFGDNSAFSQYAYYFTLGGLWTSLTLWIKSGMKQTASELTDYVLRSFTEMNRLIG